MKSIKARVHVGGDCGETEVLGKLKVSNKTGTPLGNKANAIGFYLLPVLFGGCESVSLNLAVTEGRSFGPSLKKVFVLDYSIKVTCFFYLPIYIHIICHSFLNRTLSFINKSVTILRSSVICKLVI